MKWHFAEQKMRGQCQQGWAREEVAGAGEGVAIIPPLCHSHPTGGHSAAPGTQELLCVRHGVPAFPQVFTFCFAYSLLDFWPSGLSS